MKFTKLALMAVMILSGSHSFAQISAPKITDARARAIATSAVAFFNATQGGHERLFEARGKVDAASCSTEGKKTSCTFETVETWQRDADVYSANELTIEIDNETGVMTVSFEIGC